MLENISKFAHEVLSLLVKYDTSVLTSPLLYFCQMAKLKAQSQ